MNNALKLSDSHVYVPHVPGQCAHRTKKDQYEAKSKNHHLLAHAKVCREVALKAVNKSKVKETIYNKNVQQLCNIA